MIPFGGHLRWFGKQALIGVVWIYLLSFTFDGRSIFSYANSLLVQNIAVETLDQKLTETWHRIYRTAKVGFHEFTRNDQTM